MKPTSSEFSPVFPRNIHDCSPDLLLLLPLSLLSLLLLLLPLPPPPPVASPYASPGACPITTANLVWRLFRFSSGCRTTSWRNSSTTSGRRSRPSAERPSSTNPRPKSALTWFTSSSVIASVPVVVVVLQLLLLLLLLF